MLTLEVAVGACADALSTASLMAFKTSCQSDVL